MADSIQRPVFYEGQVLGAADLEASVTYGRLQMARHEQFLHTPGIAGGLALTKAPKTTAGGKPYVDVSLGAGVGVDGHGHEIVVPDDEVLDPTRFRDLGIAVAGAWHPVFLRGLEEDAPVSASFTGACNGGSAPVRKVEAHEITFGRPGDEAAPESTPTASAQLAVSAEPDARGVLLGFVQWDSSINLFTDVADSAGGIGRRYAGVRADEVMARSGRLTLRSRPSTQPAKPMLALDEAEGGTLQFGLQDETGGLTPVFTVNAKGDVTAKGTLSVAIKTGVLVESGVASDGMLVPLPPGVTQDQVDAGQVTLHVHVSPRHPGSVRPAAVAAAAVAVTVECRVVDRRVHCRYLWFNPAAAGATALQLGACDYTMLAYVPPADGS